MIRQCKQKKIDLILTKSIQRFARNTLDCINYTRILRQLGIGVLFEKENINSLPADSEFMITMYGAMAQSESESISGNIRRGRQMHAKVGTLKVPCYRLYGYEKAEIVRELYKRYESGASLRNLQDWLEENQIKTVLGESKWTTTSIKSILTNEKYCGDVLLQKTFRTDVISKKVIKNVGQMAQYYMPDHHEAIVSREQYNAVKAEMARRSALRSPSKTAVTGRSCYTSKYALSDRRMWDTLPPLHMDIPWPKISRLALHQPPELRNKILPRFSDDQGRTTAKYNSGGDQLSHEQQTGPARPYQECGFLRASAGAGSDHEHFRYRTTAGAVR